jgi:3-oxoacyl-[acyl-carrier protein] reductase
LTPSYDLAGKVAIVTGGGSGMGREIALEYAACGAVVVVASDVAAHDEAVAEECVGFGGSAVAVPTDVRDAGAVRALVAHCLEAFGRVDVLVAAAGLDVREARSPEERHVRVLALEQWRRVIDVNLTGTFLCAREVLPPMIERGGGSIVTFSSGTVRFPLPGIGPYVSSKFGIEGLTKVLALEVVEHGLRVNAIQPGGTTDTDFFPAFVDEKQRARMHRPAVVRALAAYLAHDESRYVTGRSLVATEWNKERGIVLCPCAICTTTNPRLAVEWRGLTAL